MVYNFKLVLLSSRSMLPMWILLRALGGGLLIITGCALALPKEQRYLRSAQGYAMQEDIQRELGPPAHVAARAGETVWVYRVRGEQTGSRMTASGVWCDEYVLVFDDRGVLRRWTYNWNFMVGK